MSELIVNIPLKAATFVSRFEPHTMARFVYTFFMTVNVFIAGNTFTIVKNTSLFMEQNDRRFHLEQHKTQNSI